VTGCNPPVHTWHVGANDSYWNGQATLLRQRWKLARVMAEAERPPADIWD
jgi:hypothetical protein